MSSKRTYLPTLQKVIRTGCDYIRRWRPQIEKSIGPDNIALLDGVLVACDALDAVLEILIITAP